MTSSPTAAVARGSSSAATPAALGRFAPRLAALGLAAAAAASLTFWGLQIAATRASAPATGAAAPARLPEAAEPERVARVLAPAAPRAESNAGVPAASRLQLVGVAAGVSGRGTALIAVDGRPARPYAVGMPVGEGLVLQSVQGRRAQLGPSREGPATLVLDLPPLPR